MSGGTQYTFQNQIFQTAAQYNSAILAAAWPDSPPQYQTDSLNDLADLPPPTEMVSPVITSAGGGSRIAPDWWAKGVCDRCGFVRPLNELRYQVWDRQLTGLRVCYSCYDQDQPQLWIGEVDVQDASVLLDPRTDSGMNINSRGIAGWNPVAMNMPLGVVLNIAQVTITNGVQ